MFRTTSNLNSLDESEVLIGYMEGVSGLPLKQQATRSYWQGWRNGAVDAGLIAPDSAYSSLGAEFYVPSIN